MWQDIALMVLNIMFIVVLIPQIIHMRHTGQWMSAGTCGPTSMGLLGCSIIYFTLGMPLSSIVSLANAVIWGILLLISVKNGTPTS